MEFLIGTGFLQSAISTGKFTAENFGAFSNQHSLLQM
jgi:hypothetical protein